MCARGAGGSCRSAPRRCGCWKARRTSRAGSMPFRGETDIFITPGYRFRAIDLLMTNFHLPRSTLFMLVAAFSGLETMQRAYAHAIATGYRFYSYGDACLLHPQPMTQALLLPPDRDRRHRARGRDRDRAWPDRDAGLHAGRHAGDGEGGDAGRGRAHRRRHPARQHLSSDAAAGRRSGSQRSAACTPS